MNEEKKKLVVQVRQSMRLFQSLSHRTLHTSRSAISINVVWWEKIDKCPNEHISVSFQCNSTCMNSHDVFVVYTQMSNYRNKLLIGKIPA